MAERIQLAQQLDAARSEVDVLQTALGELRREAAGQAAELVAAREAHAAVQAEMDALRGGGAAFEAAVELRQLRVGGSVARNGSTGQCAEQVACS